MLRTALVRVSFANPDTRELSFSVAKAVISYVVYAQGVTFGGWIDQVSVARINSAVYGGWKGVIVGTAISGLVSVYDAVLKK